MQQTPSCRFRAVGFWNSEIPLIWTIDPKYSTTGQEVDISDLKTGGSAWSLVYRRYKQIASYMCEYMCAVFRVRLRIPAWVRSWCRFQAVLRLGLLSGLETCLIYHLKHADLASDLYQGYIKRSGYSGSGVTNCRAMMKKRSGDCHCLWLFLVWWTNHCILLCSVGTSWFHNLFSKIPCCRVVYLAHSYASYALRKLHP